MITRSVLLLVLFAGAVLGSGKDLAGTWACQSMNVGAYTGRPCRLEPWLRLNAGGSYEWSSEKGTWKYENRTLVLSKRAGAGRLNADGKLVFEYDLNGKHYTLILYKRQQ
jgi:hypothetical protein